MQKRGFNDYTGVIVYADQVGIESHSVGKKICFYYLYFIRRHVKNLKMGIALGKGRLKTPLNRSHPSRTFLTRLSGIQMLARLTGECPIVTLYYKQTRSFFNAKFDQIRSKISLFDLFFGFQNSQILLGNAQLSGAN